jgi:hypothetical protein
MKLVPGGGIEPPQAFWALRILSPLRLPISPSRQITPRLLGQKESFERALPDALFGPSITQVREGGQLVRLLAVRFRTLRFTFGQRASDPVAGREPSR